MAALLLSGYGCSENTNGPDPAKRMSFSTGRFNKGYKDGMRDAKWSWTDAHGGWLWLWMMEREYSQGYEQGWKDGRKAVKLKRRQEPQQSDQ